MKRNIQIIFVSLFILSFANSCTKTAYVSIEPDILTPIINQEVTYNLTSPNAVSYTVTAGDSSYWLTDSDSFTHTWTEAGTYAVDVTAYPKRGKGKGHHCILVEVFNDPSNFEGSYLMEGSCDDFTVDVSTNGLESIKLKNFGGFGFELTALTHGFKGYAFHIYKQNKTNEAGKYSFSGHGYLTATGDRLVVEYIVDYEDFSDPDLSYSISCHMDGLKL